MKMSTRKTIILDGEKITASVGLLNELAILADEASSNYKKTGFHALAGRAKNKCDEIYAQLEEMGAYKD